MAEFTTMAFTSRSTEPRAASPADRLFESCTEQLAGGTSNYRQHLGDAPKGHAAMQHVQLEALLLRLGLSANPVAIQCFGHLDGATARAIANITRWLTYLPQECVIAMVRDGWHWST
jgi:hypothetical protein